MLILVTSPSRELHPLNIDMEDNRRKQTKGSDLRSRLQRRPSHAPNAERLSPEEIILWSQSLERLLASKYYKKIKSSFRLSSRAKKIYKTYIEAEAPKEINIDHKTRDLIAQNVKTPSTVCFDEAQRIVYSLMEKDSYPRFLRSNIYRTLLDSASDYVKM
ncbi:unnamed protein product [Coregonus sp. 'balchen']|nr:unnamed protein product [Coregonus sp. 'balchen']